MAPSLKQNLLLFLEAIQLPWCSEDFLLDSGKLSLLVFTQRTSLTTSASVWGELYSILDYVHVCVCFPSPIFWTLNVVYYLEKNFRSHIIILETGTGFW